MINNYYKDEGDKDVVLEEETKVELGEYCCLGHFDALHIELLEYPGQINESVRAEINSIVVKKFKGDYNIRNVVCVTFDDTKDENFWNVAAGRPFLFVSLVNIKQTNERDLEEKVRLLNSEDNIMAYYTYDHSEIAILRTEESYIRGFNKILLLYDIIDVFKMYTVFSIREEVLQECKNIREEMIACRLLVTVKNLNEAGVFRRELARILQMEDREIKMYQTCGNNDCILEIPQVSIKDILHCYKMGNLLTHTNSLYKNAFFNVETQFLIEGRQNGSMVD